MSPVKWFFVGSNKAWRKQRETFHRRTPEQEEGKDMRGVVVSRGRRLHLQGAGGVGGPFGN